MSRGEVIEPAAHLVNLPHGLAVGEEQQDGAVAGSAFGCSGQLRLGRRPTATRRGSTGSGARWGALVALPDFGSRVLSASAVVAYVAVGAAAILRRSVCHGSGA